MFFSLPFNGLPGMGHPGPQVFEQQFSCFSMAMVGKPHLEEGDKILLPPSALEELGRMNVDYPLLFEVSNPPYSRHTHCGVLEFTAEEGRCHLPFWMMSNLLVAEGQIIQVKNVSLPKATFVKFRPQSTEFLEISNPRAVLETKLRTFSCVTLGDHLCITYMDKKFYLEITEVRPGEAASIIETDCNVDFDAPVGYKEPARPQQPVQESELQPRSLQKARADADSKASEPSFVAFGGAAKRIDAKPTQPEGVSESKSSAPPTSTLAYSTPMVTSSAPEPAPARQSRVGGRYSKTQKMGAFKGAGKSFS
jgi:ubiquitin fusion degradation protein 1